MKRMLLIAMGLLLISAAPAFAQKNKVKNKEKRFETVVKQTNADYAGRYAGFEEGFYIEVRVDSSGALAAISFEGEHRAELQNIKLEQGRMTATKVYEDGTRKEFTATFANRILNGVSDFGMIIEGDIAIAPTVIVNRVFYKRD
ncbi:MAG: hypothetical protein ICV60_13830 [Pyrinomonadaceae bacterium]|nr:hypothetical protein [Pyrinomonadaceae bacterium]